jgi:hypothetical protein
VDSIYDAVVPGIVFASVVAITFLFLGHERKKKAMLLKFLEKHSQLEAPEINRLGDLFVGKRDDLRRGVSLICIASAIALFSLLVDFNSQGNTDLNHALFGLATFPLCSGLGFLLLAFLDRR